MHILLLHFWSKRVGNDNFAMIRRGLNRKNYWREDLSGNLIVSMVDLFLSVTLIADVLIHSTI